MRLVRYRLSKTDFEVGKIQRGSRLTMRLVRYQVDQG